MRGVVVQLGVQVVGGELPHRDGGHAQRGQRWVAVLGPVEVVKAYNAELRRYIALQVAGGAERGPGEHVDAADQAGEAGAGLAEHLRGDWDGGAELVGAFVNADDFGAKLAATTLKAKHTGLGAVIVLGDAGQHRQPRVPQADQVADGRLHRGDVVVADAAGAGVGTVHADMHAGQPPLVDQVEQITALATTIKRQRVNASGDQVAGLFGFRVRRVATAGDQQLQTVRGQALLKRLDALGKNRVVDGGDHQAYGAAALRGQRPRAGIGHVAKLFNRLLNSRAQRGADNVNTADEP